MNFKQEHAFESSQKYKEGKYIIELAHMIKENGWDWSNHLYGYDVKDGLILGYCRKDFKKIVDWLVIFDK